MALRILVFNGSNRSGSYSGKVADAALRELAKHEVEVTRISFLDYPLPLMDEDLEREKGIPENAMKLARLFAAHDGMFIATPEYNGSIPPLLKNVIDWVSRVSRDGDRPLKPYQGKVVGLASSSNGHFAGIRAINHLRAVLIHIRSKVEGRRSKRSNETRRAKPRPARPAFSARSQPSTFRPSTFRAAKTSRRPDC